MNQPKLADQWQQVITATQRELNIVMEDCELWEEVDCDLLKTIVEHHLRLSQESIVVLCKILEVYSQGKLNRDFVLLLAQWT